MKILENMSVTDVSGFQAVGIHCGIKKNGKKDLCILYSKKPAVAAAALTTNTVKAAPLQVNIEHLKSDTTQAIVINSGNANACTGASGLQDAKEMANITAEALGLSPQQVMVSSTGIIGVPMPMHVIIPGIKAACEMLDSGNGSSAAEAIMTTDSFLKQITVEITLDNQPVRISGFAKGSGMVHPNMATMLSFVVTNANISKSMLSTALKESVSDSYNMISVDGDTSTNDMVIALANGTAKNTIIDVENENYTLFKQALDYVNTELAKLIAKDGEGATKFIEVSLHNACTKKDAKLCAKSVISSNLVKSAFFGADANWGRIMCALGYSGGAFSPDSVDVFFKNDKGTLQLVQDSAGLPFDEDLAKKILDESYVNIVINLKDGQYSATAWGCDLSYEYVKINGAYRT
ncbi:bifunctional glutamate N-acetyltransferase/amino-acid acetyltransferase ArgJ [Geosporobacter ferrireducens]|uniref:Arginine biosynthesis bifunctional protein ArgJ n=1 Tax=Geosporobacter ferrireducens TaxID=1424294 RepID=A0A1D8GHK3_9FIRM|nr:bifunctional glutamate N-acetyltransferase/amino-acid acetyltransferase ArgJ [Geosporobacter ferrireducens]AOT70398.1 bifunctional ornithine acetyltransferase/N-acetylglutamate synthase [Geosporobacter ferrireducens]MTI57240.1 bifunctional glutamate N-acetyltransferase/amino-acid acetyltransferase ArgJ [Geosporobacter ferrireducens]